VPRTRPPYPPEFRAEAVRLIRSSGKPLSQISKDLGVSEQSLRVWIKQADLDEGRRDDGLTSAELEELRLLRRKVRVLEEEREIPQEGSGFLRSGDRSPQMTFRLIDQEKAHHAVSLLCRVLGVSRAGF
jgi:putative transposase